MNPLSLDYLHDRVRATWLIGIDNQRVLQLTEALYQQLHQRGESGSMPRILLLEADAVNFLAGFFATVALGYPLFLGNPQWTTSEQYRVLELIQPDAILTEGCWNEPPVFAVCADDQSSRYREPPCQAAEPVSIAGHIMIPTGGSSGYLQFAVHTWKTLTASVQGFQQHLGVDRINSYCVLPLHHVSGLMQCLRAYLSGGCLAWQPYKHLVDGEVLGIDPHDWFISLVPTQLQRLLDQDRLTSTGSSLTAWLRQFRAVLVGGSPLWSALGERARKLGLPLAPTYGMTETASQVATLRPSEFLAGRAGVGRSLPHAQITIRDTNGYPLPTGTIGTIAIHATSLFLGYYPPLASEPNAQSQQSLPSTGYLTDDLGFLDQDGYLQVVG
ncbi:MAG: AMP-binding protein, partial [Cyanobacteria bacterium]|nr:AMP-binding protein [Cyanobacteriota bacterium]MDW8203271.1 AMP-binding protein [Cyanobacteriota bacterium SKYGB_h_bin112]